MQIRKNALEHNCQTRIKASAAEVVELQKARFDKDRATHRSDDDCQLQPTGVLFEEYNHEFSVKIYSRPGSHESVCVCGS
jgi:hypothetical protein